MPGLSRSLHVSAKRASFEISGSCRALVYRAHGAPADELRLEAGHVLARDAVDGVEEGKLVLVKMLAAPVNPSDINQIQGQYPLENASTVPVAGNEGVGVVAQIGGDVRTVRVGDWVVPSAPAFGTWREQVVCAEHDLHVVPNDLPLDVAASLLVNPPTAYRLLEDFCQLREGDVVVQNGANGAVGRYVIQLAAQRGVKTINVVRDRPHYEALERGLLAIGATMVVKAERFGVPEVQEYILQQVRGRRPVLGLNCVGGSAAADISRLLQDGSPVVTYGGMSGRPSVVAAAPLIFHDIRHVGFWMSRWYQRAASDPALSAERSRMFASVVDMFRRGHLRPAPMQRLDFAREWWQAVQFYTRKPPGSDADAAKPLFVFDENVQTINN